MDDAVMRESRKLLPIIGRGGLLSYQVSEAISLMLRECADRESPHAFETVSRPGADGQPHDVRVLPPLWLARLARAADTGAFKRKSVRDIVDTILTTPEPADLAEAS